MSRPEGLQGAELIAVALDLLRIAERIREFERTTEAEQRAFATWVLALARRI